MRLALVTLAFGVFQLVKAAHTKQTVFKNPESNFESPFDSQWSFVEAPSVNSTSHLIFSTVGSFLQHWPNTRYRNGHNIVPGTVPVGTLLYHGTSKNEIPKVPEWTATDPEHSYLFCRSLKSDSGCWHLTMVATRSLKVLYFDGSSAAKMEDGSMDTQDLVIWGEVKPEWARHERQRIVDLCEWGKQYEVDGYVRMEMDFEIMLCDFSAGVKTVSFLNLAGGEDGRKGPSPLPPRSPVLGSPMPPNPDRPEIDPLGVSSQFRVVEAGSWHNHFPGESRIRLDYSRLISFYDTAMFPSLQAARLGKKRLEHRLESISAADSKIFSTRLTEVLKDAPENSGSGVDWQSLVRVITNRYAERLELLQYILNSTSSTSETDAETTLNQAHRHITSMIIPYILHSAVPLGPTSVNHSWAVPVFKLCAMTHTSYLEHDEVLKKLTYSELVLRDSVKGVTKEICRIVVGLWAEGVEAGFTGPEERPAFRNEIPPQDLVRQWNSRVEGLMALLDWSYWLKCRPACTYEEMCYLPTWPFFSRPRSPKPPRPLSLRDWIRGSSNIGGKLEGERDDPQPRCIRRVEPLGFKDSFAGATQID